MRISDWSSDVCSSDLDKGLTRRLDGVELGLALLAGHRFERLDAGLLANVFPEDRDVDVFGEALDEAKPLGQRGPALEQEARAVGRRTVEQRVECPADPANLFDILGCGAKPLPG